MAQGTAATDAAIERTRSFLTGMIDASARRDVDDVYARLLTLNDGRTLEDSFRIAATISATGR